MLHKRGRWYADWKMTQGQRKRKSFPTKKQAERHQEKERRLVASKKARASEMCARLCEAWAEAAKTPRDRIAAKHLAALAGSLTVTELLPAHFESIVARWKARHKRNTICNYRIGLHRLARFIAMTAARPELPTFVPKVPNYRPRQIVADPTDLAVLVNAAPGWLRCAALLASHAGFRRSDVLRIAPIHYNREAATISILQKKGGHPVTVPVTEALAEILNNAPEGIETTPYLGIPGRKTGQRTNALANLDAPKTINTRRRRCHESRPAPHPRGIALRSLERPPRCRADAGTPNPQIHDRVSRTPRSVEASPLP